MDFEELASYLVKLGFRVDQDTFRQFQAALAQAEGAAEKHTDNILGQMVKWQLAITSAFIAVGGAIIGLMDKFATADQENRLFARHMMMSEDAARHLQMATDLLGASLDDIAWDPELSERFNEMSEALERMDKASRSVDVESGLRGIRDIRFQFSMLEAELSEIGSIVAGTLFHDLGGEEILVKLQRLNVWIQENLPAIIKWIDSNLVPVFKQFEAIGSDVLGMVRDLAVAFTNLVGLLTLDDSIEGTTFSFDNLGKAIQHVVTIVSTFVQWISLAERMTLHFVNAAILALSGLIHGSPEQLKAALAEMKAGVDDITGGSIAIVGGAGGAAYGASLGAEIGTVIAPGVGTAAGAVVGGLAGTGAGYGLGWLKELLMGSNADAGLGTRHVEADPHVAAEIDAAAERHNLSAAFLHAVAHQESGERQYDSKGDVIHSGAGAQGVMQIMPEVAAGHGLDATDTRQNIEIGASELASLMKKYDGNIDEVLAAYNWGQGHLDRAIKQHGGFAQDYLPAETQNYIRSIEARMGEQPGRGDMQVGQITVHITHPGASDHDVQRAVRDGVRDGLDRQAQIGYTNLSGAFG